MMRYIGVEAYETDDEESGITYQEDASIIVCLGDDEVKSYFERSGWFIDGIRPGGYLEIDGRYMAAGRDEEWMDLFDGSWERIMERFDKYSLPIEESPIKRKWARMDDIRGER